MPELDEIQQQEPELIEETPQKWDVYEAKPFDYYQAINKQLCAVTKAVEGEDPSVAIIGTGFVNESKTGQLDITIDGIKYSFNSSGNPVSSNASEYKLNMAISKMTSINEGNVGTTVNGYTRGEDAEGNIIYTPVTEDNAQISVDTLNARDQFAVQALKAMMDKIDDPSTLGKNEVTRYCEAAYFWSAYMMEASSKSRAIVKDSGTTTRSETVIPETATEKLLNNLIVALEKTDENIAASGDPVYAERVSNPKLLEWLNAYVDNGETGEAHGKLGLKDLIDAISQGGGGGGTGDTVQIGDEGLGRNRANPLFISNSDESKYVPYAIYQYRSKGEAESDGWEFDSTDNVWKKAYYNDVPGSYTDESAKSLPTWKNVVKVSIVEMADLIAAVNNVADAIRNQ